ncbi:ABC transporter permease [Thermoflavimicrobium daqui]|uniref:ABC-2 type transporter transmembrane domain-containing protein n=1 Tax=Thermoflavimicrobium daqui TaxID=2137476 RepID=A0A364K339_9BACL|nr:ABC transporter permease [Thermoflavimicrobium daqui]RAL23250.1 hypothetical protein DL897_12880 [Thermoflavimicrobium daqui]
MKAIWLIFKKEILEQFRDRKTIFNALLLPVLMWVGIAFATDRFAGDSSNFSQSDTSLDYKVAVTSAWSKTDQDQFTKMSGIKTYIAKDPAKEVKEGKSNVYIDLDKNTKQMKLYVSDKEPNPVLITQIENYVYKLNQSKLSPKESKNQFKLITSKTQGKENTFLKIYQGFAMFNIIIAMTPLIAGSAIATDAIAGERERGTIRSILSLPFSATTIWSGKWLAVCFYSALSVIISFSIYSGIQPLLKNPTLNISWLKALPIHFHIGLVILLLLYIGMCAALLLFVSTFAKSYKEAQGYYTPVLLVPGGITFYIGFGMQGQETLSHTFFFIPFSNIQSVVYEGAAQSLTFSHLLLAIGSSFVFIVLMIWISASLFKQPKRMLAN